jgi:hypothetical protein
VLIRGFNPVFPGGARFPTRRARHNREAGELRGAKTGETDVHCVHKPVGTSNVLDSKPFLSTFNSQLHRHHRLNDLAVDIRETAVGAVVTEGQGFVIETE